jgi:hypothetical protein
MKKTIFTTMMLMAFAAQAQEVFEPFGFIQHEAAFQSIPCHVLPTFNQDSLLKEDTRTEEIGGRTNIGRLIFLHQDQTQLGQWRTLSNGDRIWQYRFRTAHAKGVCVYFEKLHLPEGGMLTLYPVNRSYFVGPFTSEDCNAHGHFMAGEVGGDEAILEYYQPAGVVGEASIGMKAISHMYRYVYADRDMDPAQNRASDFCEVDIKCPEGDDWVDEKNSVVRLLIVEGNLQGYCSGAMVNTTAMDCRKYLLTALHCGETVTDADWLSCSVRFNYQRSGCGTGISTTTNNRVGVYHLADSQDGGGSTGSDFLLLELEDDIPANYNVYFAGWSADAVTPADVVGIHHPAGDVKKISTATNVVSSTWQAPGNHWKVVWMETETNWGVTEGGSSGSPIFDQNRKIVGHLTGGSSYCDSPSQPDFYGKLDKDWDDNPNPASQELKVWLDPGNTGLTNMLGAYRNPNAVSPCDPALANDVLEIQFHDLVIAPAICDAFTRVTIDRFQSVESIRLFDSTGRLMNQWKMSDNSLSIDTQSLSSGTYFITCVQNAGAHITKKLVVIHP